MDGVFVAQRPLTTKVETVMQDDGTAVMVQTVRNPGEVVPEANDWPASALDAALSRGELVYVSPETIELRDRISALEEQVAQLTNRTVQKKGN